MWTHYKFFEKFDVGFCNKTYERPHLNNPLSEKCRHWANPRPADCVRFFMVSPYPAISSELILNLTVLTQHCSSLVVHMFKISIKTKCIFSRLDSLLRAFY